MPLMAGAGKGLLPVSYESADFFAFFLLENAFLCGAACAAMHPNPFEPLYAFTP
jgi:hypothetical protein